eukprot:TRINITY_DN32451_c0_g1_i1.p2 TRINITY_DN32451_c0_g1~~TRINITY_DN32451_c0_g1_i1.p2  ORF type:complete len:205 (-),score=23.25 TRINITY_DN32451_c0_g1_i1:1199-1813(-)
MVDGEVELSTSRVERAVGLALESAPEPHSFKCPISGEVMADPVVTCDGHVYDRQCIEMWFATGSWRSPMTNRELASLLLTPEAPLKRAIEEYMQARPEIGRKTLDFLSLEEAAATLQQDVVDRAACTENDQSLTLFDAISNGKADECIRAVARSSPEAINSVDGAGRTALHAAAVRGLASVCFAILEQPFFISRIDVILGMSLA